MCRFGWRAPGALGQPLFLPPPKGLTTPAAVRPRYIRLTKLQNSVPPSFREGQSTGLAPEGTEGTHPYPFPLAPDGVISQKALIISQQESGF